MESSKTTLTPEQMDLYKSILNEFERTRNMTEAEKELLILEITTSTYMDLLCDWAFKHVFGHNKENLLLLLNDILPEEVIDIEYDPNESDKNRPHDKQIIMDVICHTKDRSFIVEMQKSRKMDLKNRLFYYGAASLTRQLKPKDGYDKIVPVYVICFSNFKLLHKEDQLIYRYKMQEIKTHELYGNQLTIFLCELPRFVNTPGKKLNPVEVWFDMLRNMRTFASRPDNIDERYESIFESCRMGGLKDKETLQYLRAMITEEEKQEIRAGSYEYGFEEGMQQGMEKGMEKGMERERQSTISRLLAYGMSPEEIAKALNVTLEEIAAAQ